MKLVVAVNNKGYIGLNGEIPWRSKSDFKNMKELTMGGSLILGRKTFEEDLKKRKLVGREMFIVGTGYDSLFEALKKAILSNKTIWVFGGNTIYQQLFPLVDEVHISYINDDTIGDTKFEIPKSYRGKIYEYKFEKD